MTRFDSRFIHRFGLYLAAALFWTFSALMPLQAETLSLDSEKAVQAVIKSQLAAFASDDADKAFSYATPELRQSVGSASAFMTMVKNSYPVVYRPASVAFLKLEKTGDDALQRVQMLDASGTSWLAVYRVEMQKDKTWRISGCILVENSGRVA